MIKYYITSLLLILLYSCTDNKINYLNQQIDTLTKLSSEEDSKYLEVKHELEVARDSIKVFQNTSTQLQYPSKKLYAFAAVDYLYSGIGKTEYYHNVSNIYDYEQLDEEAKYRWLDTFSNTFLQQHSTLSNYSIDKRKVYTFTNYIEASKMREEVLKYGIDPKTINDLIDNYGK